MVAPLDVLGRGLRKLRLWTRVGLLNVYGPADLPPDQNPVQQAKLQHGSAADLGEMVDQEQGGAPHAPVVADPVLAEIADAEHRRQARRAADLEGEQPFAPAARRTLPAAEEPAAGAAEAARHREVQLGEGLEDSNRGAQGPAAQV
jgi:hypothetical protein